MTGVTRGHGAMGAPRRRHITRNQSATVRGLCRIETNMKGTGLTVFHEPAPNSTVSERAWGFFEVRFCTPSPTSRCATASICTVSPNRQSGSTLRFCIATDLEDAGIARECLGRTTVQQEGFCSVAPSRQPSRDGSGKFDPTPLAPRKAQFLHFLEGALIQPFHPCTHHSSRSSHPAHGHSSQCLLPSIMQ